MSGFNQNQPSASPFPFDDYVNFLSEDDVLPVEDNVFPVSENTVIDYEFTHEDLESLTSMLRNDPPLPAMGEHDHDGTSNSNNIQNSVTEKELQALHYEPELITYMEDLSEYFDDSAQAVDDVPRQPEQQQGQQQEQPQYVAPSMLMLSSNPPLPPLMQTSSQTPLLSQKRTREEDANDTVPSQKRTKASGALDISGVTSPATSDAPVSCATSQTHATPPTTPGLSPQPAAPQSAAAPVSASSALKAKGTRRSVKKDSCEACRKSKKKCVKNVNDIQGRCEHCVKRNIGTCCPGTMDNRTGETVHAKHQVTYDYIVSNIRGLLTACRANTLNFNENNALARIDDHFKNVGPHAAITLVDADITQAMVKTHQLYNYNGWHGMTSSFLPSPNDKYGKIAEERIATEQLCDKGKRAFACLCQMYMNMVNGETRQWAHGCFEAIDYHADTVKYAIDNTVVSEEAKNMMAGAFEEKLQSIVDGSSRLVNEQIEKNRRGTSAL